MSQRGHRKATTEVGARQRHANRQKRPETVIGKLPVRWVHEKSHKIMKSHECGGEHVGPEIVDYQTHLQLFFVIFERAKMFICQHSCTRCLLGTESYHVSSSPCTGKNRKFHRNNVHLISFKSCATESI